MLIVHAHNSHTHTCGRRRFMWRIEEPFWFWRYPIFAFSGELSGEQHTSGDMHLVSTVERNMNFANRAINSFARKCAKRALALFPPHSYALRTTAIARKEVNVRLSVSAFVSFSFYSFCENHKLTMLCVVFDVFSHKNCLNWMHYSILCHHSFSRDERDATTSSSTSMVLCFRFRIVLLTFGISAVNAGKRHCHMRTVYTTTNDKTYRPFDSEQDFNKIMYSTRYIHPASSTFSSSSAREWHDLLCALNADEILPLFYCLAVPHHRDTETQRTLDRESTFEHIHRARTIMRLQAIDVDGNLRTIWWPTLSQNWSMRDSVLTEKSLDDPFEVS